MGITIGMLFVLVFVVVGLLYFLIPKVIKHWLFWFGLSMAIFIFSVGGTVYNVMHQPPTTGFDRNTNTPIYFSPEVRGQYFLEGYLGSSMCLFPAPNPFRLVSETIPELAARAPTRD